MANVELLEDNYFRNTININASFTGSLKEVLMELFKLGIKSLGIIVIFIFFASKNQK